MKTTALVAALIAAAAFVTGCNRQEAPGSTAAGDVASGPLPPTGAGPATTPPPDPAASPASR